MATFLNDSAKVANQDIESCPKWFSFDVEFDINAETVPLIDSHEGLVILDAYVDVLQAGDGTTNGLDLRLRDDLSNDTDVLTGVNLQTAGTRQTGTVNPGTNPENYPRQATDSPETLIAAVSESGTTTTPPQARISLLMYRLVRPGAKDHLPAVPA